MIEYKPEPEKWGLVSAPELWKVSNDHECTFRLGVIDPKTGGETGIKSAGQIPSRALAAFILRACQSYGPMLKALKGADYQQYLAQNHLGDGDPDSVDEDVTAARIILQAAIAKAEGRA